MVTFFELWALRACKIATGDLTSRWTAAEDRRWSSLWYVACIAPPRPHRTATPMCTLLFYSSSNVRSVQHVHRKAQRVEEWGDPCLIQYHLAPTKVALARHLTSTRPTALGHGVFAKKKFGTTARGRLLIEQPSEGCASTISSEPRRVGMFL